MNKLEVKVLRDKLTQLLSANEKKLGFKFRLGRATYSDNSTEFKLECLQLDAEGSFVTPEQEAFVRHCSHYALEPTDFNKSFKYQNRTYTIVGLKPRSRTHPIICVREDGKKFNFSATTVKIYL